MYPDFYFNGAYDTDVNFYNWNRFYLIYCDGTGHQGYIEKPVVVKGKPLYFRGHFNVAAHFTWIFNLLPPELTDKFVVFGCSAGGLATYTWLDTIAEYINNVNPMTKVYGFAGSGFFVDYPSNRTGKNDYA